MTINWAQTERRAARITLAEGLVIQGDIHLQPRVAWRDGPETPLEMLNRAEAFFPVSLPSGEVAFVGKTQVASLHLGASAEEADPERKDAMRNTPLEVMMVGGGVLRGVVVSELPPTRTRALDVLNAAERFFLLHTDSGTLCINRQFVRAARPLS